MIKNQWYGILDSKELKKNKQIGVTRLNEKLVLWRDSNGKVNCIADKCCHRGASISMGKLDECKDNIACPFHGFAYDGTGKAAYIPANGKNTPVADRYHVKAFHCDDKYGFIWLWFGEMRESYPDIPFFEYLRTGFSYGGFSETWSVHYTRAIENQLDVVHLPFVHATTIGRGNKTLVNGPVVEWKDNLMTFYVDNVLDDGKTTPLKSEEIKNFRNFFSLQFQMPNMWQNRISDDIRIVAVFAPIDSENTHIYLRFYQRFIKLPILKQLVNYLSNFSNAIILHQDRRVVLKQLPKMTEYKINENLIQGDLPIIEYRKRRAELKVEGEKSDVL
ncbi:MAG: aromatic ring-hydroxylating dioxygenase subunit alpha [Bacillota bacterium]